MLNERLPRKVIQRRPIGGWLVENEATNVVTSLPRRRNDRPRMLEALPSFRIGDVSGAKELSILQDEDEDIFEHQVIETR